MISGGRTSVRCGLYMATLVAIRHNQVIRKFYERLLTNGKLKKVALVACIRKLLVILNAMIRDHNAGKHPLSPVFRTISLLTKRTTGAVTLSCLFGGQKIFFIPLDF